MLLPNFTEWLVGFIIVLVITTSFYVFGLFIAPIGHFNYIEWFGLVMLFVTTNAGRLSFIQTLNIRKFINDQKEKGIDEDDITTGDYINYLKEKEDANIS